ncbi:cadherin-like and PC-esterase domain-containing protein 1 [Megalops cyprinoides]|uniref:cadherin-like and PC-esterase domain-containing protein 1 n=1 Tax=Megalops cyprinoides TaxID=118141 RepID=UPI001863A484|nr:cadherin-like and PC-esterase domain-containing protein 1 [Megalops cyprinoides]
MLCLLSAAVGAAREAGMIGRRLWALRRRCCPRSVLLIAVAICLFYQTLVVARSRFKATDSNQPNKSAEADERFVQLLYKYPRRLISVIESLQNETANVARSRQTRAGLAGRALVLTGQHVATATEVQLYQRVLEEHGYSVRVSQFSTLRQDSSQPGDSDWAVLICLRGSEKSCRRRMKAHPLQPHQRVNTIPAMTRAFSDADGLCRFQSDGRLAGLALPIIPSACVQPGAAHNPAKDQQPRLDAPNRPAAGHGFTATVKTYVLVTSVTPLTAFIHPTGLVKTDSAHDSYVTKLQSFFRKLLSADASPQALRNMKEVVGGVLLAAAMTAGASESESRCGLCFQLLTLTLQFNSSLRPEIVQVQDELHFEDLEDPGFEGQIAKELILEDALNFLLPARSDNHNTPSTSSELGAVITQYSGCVRTNSACLLPNEVLLLLQFLWQLKKPGPFELLYPESSPALSHLQRCLDQRFHGAEGSGKGVLLATLLDWVRNQTDVWGAPAGTTPPACGCHICRQAPLKRGAPLERYFSRLRIGDPEGQGGRSSPEVSQNSLTEKERCSDPHLRQVYTDPPLVLTPPFSPWVKEYRAEVPFDVVTVRIRAEPVGRHCQVHLDERRGPRTANYPVGLGNSRISVLVMDESEPEPVVMTIYTLNIFRESRPSLPMFDEYVMCGFVQDCGLVVQPDQPCGLEPLPGSPISGKTQASLGPCSSGDAPGRWVVPCLSCSDNRTCDWREVSWRPDGCYHPLLARPQLQNCMMGRKVLFIGDSTNRGMMYYLMERVNATLDDWDKAHDTVVYHVNEGRTLISYSYYPQFWLEKARRPTFEQALEQLIKRSRPLENSPQTVLVTGGVQWLNTNHLNILHEVLKRENLLNILVVIKSLGMGFHLPVDGIRSLSLRGVQDLYNVNEDILTTAKLYGFEVIDTFRITMGRYKEFLQGKCACHFHEVEKLTFSEEPLHRKMKLFRHSEESRARAGEPPTLQDPWSASNSPYHVKGTINQVYSEVLLSRLCWRSRKNATARSL